MTARTYKDKFTLDGRLKVVPGVSKQKVAAVKALLERHNRGDKIATATLQEALTTSDAIFNLAYLANVNFLPDYDEAERNWNAIAGTRTAPDLRPITLYSMQNKWTNGDDTADSNVLGPNGEAPVVPEGSAYPYAYMSQAPTHQQARVVKRGFKTDWTLEARINDGLGLLDALPQEMLEVALDTEEADVWGALITQTPASSALAGGVIPDGSTTVAPNAPFSREAVIRAMIELSNREVNGRKQRFTGRWNLIVPVGQALFVNFVLNQTLQGIEQGGAGTSTYIYQVNGGYNPLAGINVIESEWVTGNAWYLMPVPGSTRRPVLERLNLRGYEAPQLFVENLAGTFIGGGAVSPFEGSFDADVITLKLRHFGGGVLWDNGAAVLKSNGSGLA